MRAHKLPWVLTHVVLLLLIVSLPAKAADVKTDMAQAHRVAVLIGGGLVNVIHFNVADPVTQMATSTTGGDRYQVTTTGKTQGGPIDFSFHPQSMPPALSSWILDAIRGAPSTRPVEVQTFDKTGREVGRQNYSNYAISQVTFPTLNPESSSFATMSVQIIPSTIPLKSGSGGGSAPRIDPNILAKEAYFIMENSIGLPGNVQVHAASPVTCRNEGGRLQISPVQLSLNSDKDGTAAVSDLVKKASMGVPLRGQIAFHLLDRGQTRRFSIELHALTIVSFQPVQPPPGTKPGPLFSELTFQPGQINFVAR